ncbi:MAG TPA: DUF3386 family protein [Pirellulales bacterium]|jgi:hypothetical protein
MQRLILSTACGLAALVAVPLPYASAHFLWIDVPTAAATEKPVAEVYFNEGPTAGSARLATKIAGTKAWLHNGSAATTPLELTLVKTEEDGHLTTPINASSPYSAEAQFEYGIFKHDGEAILLNYYAQHVAAAEAREISALTRASSLPLTIVPRADAAGWICEILWEGKPAADCQVVVDGPGIDAKEFQSDAQGRVQLPAVRAGKYALRARRVENREGKKDDQSYKAVHHYATLTAVLPEITAVAAAPVPATATAQEILTTARDARAVWDDFPGFSADLVLRQGTENRTGRITVSAEGDVQLAGFDGMELGRVEQVLASLVQHRMGGGGPTGAVSFVAEEAEHPLGRMIRFDEDKDLHSAYRVTDGVVTEVNRQMGPSRFTISVLDVYRNPAGKYLPTTFNVSFWDKDFGKLTSSETHLNQWLDVGGFDLPQRIVILRAEDQKRDVVSLSFANHQLLSAAKKK